MTSLTEMKTNKNKTQIELVLKKMAVELIIDETEILVNYC